MFGIVSMQQSDTYAPEQILYSGDQQIGPETVTVTTDADVHPGDILGVKTVDGKYTICRHTYLSKAALKGDTSIYLHTKRGLKAGDILHLVDGVTSEDVVISAIGTSITDNGWKVDTSALANPYTIDVSEAYVEDGSQAAVAIAANHAPALTMNEECTVPIFLRAFLRDPSRDDNYSGSGHDGSTVGGLLGVVSQLDPTKVNSAKITALGLVRKNFGATDNEISYFKF